MAIRLANKYQKPISNIVLQVEWSEFRIVKVRFAFQAKIAKSRLKAVT